LFISCKEGKKEKGTNWRLSTKGKEGDALRAEDGRDRNLRGIPEKGDRKGKRGGGRSSSLPSRPGEGGATAGGEKVKKKREPISRIKLSEKGGKGKSLSWEGRGGEEKRREGDNCCSPYMGERKKMKGESRAKQGEIEKKGGVLSLRQTPKNHTREPRRRKSNSKRKFPINA